jgi:hypothetical protein
LYQQAREQRREAPMTYGTSFAVMERLGIDRVATFDYRSLCSSAVAPATATTQTGPMVMRKGRSVSLAECET